MTLREFLEHEMAFLKQALHLDPLEERTWECDPLLVADENGAVIFFGHTNVAVKPHPDGTADLLADEYQRGRRPRLVNAHIECFSTRSSTQGRTRNGLRCKGCDEEGRAFVWHINGAAYSFGETKMRHLRMGPVPTEETAD